MERFDYWQVLRDQPTSLTASAQAIRSALAEIDPPAWPEDQSVGILAMGASTFAAEMLTATARDQGRTVLNWPASEWPSRVRPQVAVSIAISESGRSPETIAAFQQAEGFRIATTNVPDSPITQDADLVVGWGDVPDAGVYLSGYTASLLALGALGDWLGLDGLAEPATLDVAPWISAATRAVDALLAEHFADTMPAAVDCVGAGTSWAAAQESALMMREAGRTPSGTYPLDQYLHGPAESMRPDQVLLVFGGGRADELAHRADSLGIPLLHVAPSPIGRHGLCVPESTPVVERCIREAIVGQVLSGRLGDRRGHELGTFLHTFADTKLAE